MLLVSVRKTKEKTRSAPFKQAEAPKISSDWKNKKSKMTRIQYAKLSDSETKTNVSRKHLSRNLRARGEAMNYDRMRSLKGSIYNLV